MLTSEKPDTMRTMLTLQAQTAERLRAFVARRNAALAPAKLSQSAVIDEAVREYLDKREREERTA